MTLPRDARQRLHTIPLVRDGAIHRRIDSQPLSPTVLPPSALPPPDSMAMLVRRALPDWADVQWLAETGSTNSDLLEQARAGLPQPRLRGAHLQRQGRGRANRNFRAEPAQTLIFSCSFATSLPLAALP